MRMDRGSWRDLLCSPLLSSRGDFRFVPGCFVIPPGSTGAACTPILLLVIETVAGITALSEQGACRIYDQLSPSALTPCKPSLLWPCKAAKFPITSKCSLLDKNPHAEAHAPMLPHLSSPPSEETPQGVGGKTQLLHASYSQLPTPAGAAQLWSSQDPHAQPRPRPALDQPAHD